MRVRSKKSGRVFEAVTLTQPYERITRRGVLRGAVGDVLVQADDGGWPVKPENLPTVYDVLEA